MRDLDDIIRAGAEAFRLLDRAGIARCLAALEALPAEARGAAVSRAVPAPEGRARDVVGPLVVDVAGRYRADLVRRFLDWGADVEATGEGGETPLLAAATHALRDEKAAQAETVSLLLAAGADPGATDEDGETVLMRLAFGALPALVLDVIDRVEAVDARDADGRSALMEAASRASAEVAARLLERGADPNARDRTGVTPLMEAARDGGPAVVATLLSAGADVAAADAEGRTALDRALGRFGDRDGPMVVHVDRVAAKDRLLWSTEDEEVIAMVLDADARPTGAEAIADAARYGTPAVLRRVLDVLAPASSERAVTRALHGAASNGRAETIPLLLAAGASLEGRLQREEEDAAGATPLVLAAAEGRHAAVRALLSAGADPDAADDRGRTALHFAARHGEHGLVRLLVEAGADVRARDVLGQSPRDVLLAFDETERLSALGLPAAERDPARLAEADRLAVFAQVLVAQLPGDPASETTAFVTALHEIGLWRVERARRLVAALRGLADGRSRATTIPRPLAFRVFSIHEAVARIAYGSDWDALNATDEDGRTLEDHFFELEQAIDLFVHGEPDGGGGREGEGSTVAMLVEAELAARRRDRAV